MGLVRGLLRQLADRGPGTGNDHAKFLHGEQAEARPPVGRGYQPLLGGHPALQAETKAVAVANLLDGMSTVTITVSDSHGATGATSFTIQKDSIGVYPPTIGNIPNETIRLGTAPDGIGATYSPVWFVVGDLNDQGQDDSINLLTGASNLTFELNSSNTSLVPEDMSHLKVTPTNGPTRSYTLTVNTTNNITNPRAVITVKVKDPSDNWSSTPFVIDVVPASNLPPEIIGVDEVYQHPNWVEDTTSTAHSYTYDFHVSDPNVTNESDLLVTAVSSNTSLVPASGLQVVAPNNNGDGSVTITPNSLPVITGNITKPQATTITLTVADQAYRKGMQFLYVRRNLASNPIMFLRPCGIYNLDPGEQPIDQHRGDDLFLTGEMRRASWAELEPDGPGNTHYGDVLTPIIQNLPPGQFLSLNLIDTPSWVDDQATERWCSGVGSQWECDDQCLEVGGTFKPAPWDQNLRTARDNFLHTLAEWDYTGTGSHFRDFPRLRIINPNLPGGDTGFRDGEVHLYNMCGYSRNKLWTAAKTLLDKVQDEFSQQLVQFGFFKVSDPGHCDIGCDQDLWQWLYPRFRDRYNGNAGTRPRVSLFQEDVTASRGNASPEFIPYNPVSNTAYMLYPDPAGSPIPSFAYDPNDWRRYNNGMTYQANTPWTAPAHDGDKVDKTLNSNPNDGLEGAFNNYFNQYLETYVGDLDHAQLPDGSQLDEPVDASRWQAGLQSWHDYLDYLCSQEEMDAPAGLTVQRTSATSNTVSWFAVYGAASYKLQAKPLSPPGEWVDVKGCDPLVTVCTDTALTGSQYAYRVQAVDEKGEKVSPWANVGVFLSEKTYDGYVSDKNGDSTEFAEDVEPGIQAGQGTDTDLAGFLSFETSLLGEKATVVGATLRLKQYSDDKAFDALGSSFVDIAKGAFNDNAELEGADFAAAAAITNVINEDAPLSGVGAENWVEAEVAAANVTYVNNADRTQFRLYFAHVDKLNDTFVGWYSGDSLDNEPQLLVRYIEPES